MSDHFEPCPACSGNGYIVRDRDPKKPLPQLVTYPCAECDSTGIAAPKPEKESA